VIDVAFNGVDVLIRDDKHPGQAPLVFSRAEWATFLAAAIRGEIRPQVGLDETDPLDRVIILLQESALGHVEWDAEGHRSVWTRDGAEIDVTAEVAGMGTAGLMYRSLHTSLWRPTRTGREAIDRGGV
jgi:hypothetical protein